MRDFIILVVLMVVVVVIGAVLTRKVSSVTTQVSVWTDEATGCDYLLANSTGVALYPRLAADGKQVCRVRK